MITLPLGKEMSPRRLDAETLESLVALDNWQKGQWVLRSICAPFACLTSFFVLFGVIH